MKKKIVIGLVIVVVVGVAVAGGWYWREREKDREAVKALKLDETVFPKDKQVDQSKLSFPAPANKIELSKLLDYIIGMDFPECQGIKGAKPAPDDKEFRELVARCQMRLMSEIQRIREIRDPAMVPKLIDLALTKTTDYGPLPENFNDKEKIEYHGEVICRARFNAIYSLGEIGDPRAIEPLLKLIDEPPPMGTDTPEKLLAGCFILAQGSTGEDYATTICATAANTLKSFKGQLDSAIIPSLLDSLDNLPPKNIDINKEASYFLAYVPSCNLYILSQFGQKGLDSLLEKYHDQNTSDYAKTGFAEAIKNISDPSTIPTLRELLHDDDKLLAENAAKALGAMASPNLVDEYLWMIQEGHIEPACEALGKIKDPSTVPALIKFLDSDNRIISTAAADALGKIGPLAKDAVPVLSQKLLTCQESHPYIVYTKALGDIGDERAVPILYEIALKRPSDGDPAISAIGKIQSETSVDFLKKIIANEGRINNDPKYKNLRIKAVDGLLRLRGDQALSYICLYREDPELKSRLERRCR